GRRQADATQASRGSGLHGPFGCLLHRPRREIRRRQAGGVRAWFRHRSARQYAALSLGEIRRIRQSDNGNRATRSRAPGPERRSAKRPPRNVTAEKRMKRDLTERLEAAIAETKAIDRTASALSAWLNKGFQTGALRPLKLFLNGSWLGHPLHPLLTDIPI